MPLLQTGRHGTKGRATLRRSAGDKVLSLAISMSLCQGAQCISRRANQKSTANSKDSRRQRRCLPAYSPFTGAAALPWRRVLEGGKTLTSTRKAAEPPCECHPVKQPARGSSQRHRVPGITFACKAAQPPRYARIEQRAASEHRDAPCFSLGPLRAFCFRV